MHEQRIEKHLYERKHQTATGEWSRSYYIRLKDWKGVRRVWPAGNTLKTARAKRAEYEHRNGMKDDFDKVKDMTFAKWTAIYLDKYAKDKRSHKRDELSCRNLTTVFGSFLLPQITRRHVEEYKQTRKESPTNRKTIRSEASINRELACLKHLLKLAAEEGLLDHIPVVKLYREDNARERALSTEEYQQLLSAASPHLQRIITCAYETGMRGAEIKKLTWDKVDLKTGFIKLSTSDTKRKEKRLIPISPTLRDVLEAIRTEQREAKITAITGHVFVWKGKPMTEGWKTAFNAACRRAGLKGLWFHDLRHTFVTRKVREGWDYKRIMAITGHKTFAVFQRYNNPSEEDIKEVVLAESPRFVYKNATATFPHGAHMTGKPTEAVA
jgi:integrase